MRRATIQPSDDHATSLSWLKLAWCFVADPPGLRTGQLCCGHDPAFTTDGAERAIREPCVGLYASAPMLRNVRGLLTSARPRHVSAGASVHLVVEV